MPPRFKPGLVLACAILLLYVVFWRGERLFGARRYGVHVFKATDSQSLDGSGYTDSSNPLPETARLRQPTSPAGMEGYGKDKLTLQEQYEKEYEVLGRNQTAGAIYRQTLLTLVESSALHNSAGASLRPVESWSEKSGGPPYKYNPYPDYNGQAWRTNNQGMYRACDGPGESTEDLGAYRGHPTVFGKPLIGSWVPMDLDSNLCFERESRLGPYGYESDDDSLSNRTKARTNFANADWGLLQEKCVHTNHNRFVNQGPSEGKSTNSASVIPEKRRYLIDAESNDRHRFIKAEIKPAARTAIIIRTHSDQTYSENDKQNIRSLISELCLGSGGEYQVYLLVQIKDSTLKIFQDTAIYQKAIQASVPAEFSNMTVLWNDAQMRELYPLIPTHVNNVHQSQWLSVQKFAQDHLEFDYFWNWEFDVRYTGHHYNLLDKISTFAKTQARRGLWERNERYYIPSYHSNYSKFSHDVSQIPETDSIWGAPWTPSIEPIGPPPPVPQAADDDSEWGHGEEADYISLAPIFNPVNTTWPGRNDVWGYAGGDTQRRATIGTHSRCSRKLLSQMHRENWRGNHVSSEMTPQTVALLHGLKAVFAPIPLFFDRDWPAESLQRFFNPGPNGVCGTHVESPFSWARESRFQGSTWYFRTSAPMRLYNNWLGWEDSGVGGGQWEKSHGRPCLPPILLHPIKSPTKPPPGHYSTSDLPYKP